jgi:hypothetical protein
MNRAVTAGQVQIVIRRNAARLQWMVETDSQEVEKIVNRHRKKKGLPDAGPEFPIKPMRPTGGVVRAEGLGSVMGEDHSTMFGTITTLSTTRLSVKAEKQIHKMIKLSQKVNRTLPPLSQSAPSSSGTAGMGLGGRDSFFNADPMPLSMNTYGPVRSFAHFSTLNSRTASDDDIEDGVSTARSRSSAVASAEHKKKRKKLKPLPHSAPPAGKDGSMDGDTVKKHRLRPITTQEDHDLKRSRLRDMKSEVGLGKPKPSSI